MKTVNTDNVHGEIHFHRITMMPDCSSQAARKGSSKFPLDGLEMIRCGSAGDSGQRDRSLRERCSRETGSVHSRRLDCCSGCAGEVGRVSAVHPGASAGLSKHDLTSSSHVVESRAKLGF